MAFSPMTSVAVAIDSTISFGRFAHAIGKAGLRLKMCDGVLSVFEAPVTMIPPTPLVPPTPAVRATPTGRVAKSRVRRGAAARSPARTK